MTQPRPYVLAETNWKTVKATDYQVAILPWGATEAHNYHLPYATDNIQAAYVANESARLAWEAGARIIVFPEVPFGVNTGQLNVKLCLNMNPSTQYLVLKDIVDVLSRQGVGKLVILNGHGGNYFKQMVRELYTCYPDVLVCTLNWWQTADAHQYFEEPGDHAGELETSAVMHIAPQWVLPLSEAGDGKDKKFKIKGLRDGWVSTQRMWTQVTEDTGVGNPQKASARKGKAFIEAVTKNISEFLIALAKTPKEDLYA